MSAVDEIVALGENSINNLLAHADELKEVIQKSFPAVTLDEIHAKFAALPVPADKKADLNSEVVALYGLVRHHASIAVEQLRNAEMWIAMKAPSVSDGNNFGVDVQNFVMGEVQAMRTKVQPMVEGLSNYHWQRGLGLEKIPGSKTSESSESESVEQDGDKTTNKTTKSSSSKTTKEAALDDFIQYKVALDVKAYHTAYVQLSDIRMCYIKASVMFNNNLKRLADPRGEGDGSNKNVMSMF